MKMAIKFLCILYMIVYTWSQPVIDDLDDLDLGDLDDLDLDDLDDLTDLDSTKPTILSLCPKPMCRPVQQPCDDIQKQYTTVNGRQCPLCAYCASPKA